MVESEAEVDRILPDHFGGGLSPILKGSIVQYAQSRVAFSEPPEYTSPSPNKNLTSAFVQRRKEPSDPGQEYASNPMNLHQR